MGKNTQAESFKVFASCIWAATNSWMRGFTAHARFSSCQQTSARQRPETTLTSVVNLSLDLTTPRLFIFHRRKRIYLTRRSAGASGATAQSSELVIFHNPGRLKRTSDDNCVYSPTVAAYFFDFFAENESVVRFSKPLLSN